MPLQQLLFQMPKPENSRTGLRHKHDSIWRNCGGVIMQLYILLDAQVVPVAILHSHIAHPHYTNTYLNQSWVCQVLLILVTGLSELSIMGLVLNFHIRHVTEDPDPTTFPLCGKVLLLIYITSVNICKVSYFFLIDMEQEFKKRFCLACWF